MGVTVDPPVLDLFRDVSARADEEATLVRALLVRGERHGAGFSANIVLKLVSTFSSKAQSDQEELRPAMNALLLDGPGAGRNVSAAVLYRLDSRGAAGLWEWICVLYQPDDAPIKDKMQFGNIRTALLSAIGESNLLDVQAPGAFADVGFPSKLRNARKHDYQNPQLSTAGKSAALAAGTGTGGARRNFRPVASAGAGAGAGASSGSQSALSPTKQPSLSSSTSPSTPTSAGITSLSESKPEPNLEPKPQPTPESKPESAPESKPEPTPESQPESAPESKSEPTSASKPEPSFKPSPEPSFDLGATKAPISSPPSASAWTNEPRVAQLEHKQATTTSVSETSPSTSSQPAEVSQASPIHEELGQHSSGDCVEQTDSKFPSETSDHKSQLLPDSPKSQPESGSQAYFQDQPQTQTQQPDPVPQVDSTKQEYPPEPAPTPARPSLVDTKAVTESSALSSIDRADGKLEALAEEGSSAGAESKLPEPAASEFQSEVETQSRSQDPPVQGPVHTDPETPAKHVTSDSTSPEIPKPSATSDQDVAQSLGQLDLNGLSGHEDPSASNQNQGAQKSTEFPVGEKKEVEAPRLSTPADETSATQQEERNEEDPPNHEGSSTARATPPVFSPPPVFGAPRPASPKKPIQSESFDPPTHAAEPPKPPPVFGVPKPASPINHTQHNQAGSAKPSKSVGMGSGAVDPEDENALVRQAEAKERADQTAFAAASSAPGIAALGGVGVNLQPAAVQAITDLRQGVAQAEGTANTVILSLQKGEQLGLAEPPAQLAPQGVQARLAATPSEARLAFYRYPFPDSEQKEGEQGDKQEQSSAPKEEDVYLYIYSCPSGTPVRQRMLYSVSVMPLLAAARGEQLGLKRVKKVEVTDIEDLTPEVLAEAAESLLPPRNRAGLHKASSRPLAGGNEESANEVDVTGSIDTVDAVDAVDVTDSFDDPAVLGGAATLAPAVSSRPKRPGRR